MRSKLRAHLTYANVMATVAVFIALGGSSYAALKVTSRNVPKDALTGADIKNLTGKDVRNNSLTGADVKNLGSGDVVNGRLLAEDFGPGQLPQGAKGEPGKNGATNAVVRTTTVTGLGANRSVKCNPGERALGGGASLTNGGSSSGDQINASYPIVSGDPDVPAPAGAAPDGWNTGFSVSGGENRSMTFYVVCASP